MVPKVAQEKSETKECTATGTPTRGSTKRMLSSALTTGWAGLLGGLANVTITPWCDNSFRVQIAPSTLPAELVASRQALRATLAKEGLDELPSALIKGCAGGQAAHTAQTLELGQSKRHGNLQASVLSDGRLSFSTVDDGKGLFDAMPTFKHTPAPSPVDYAQGGAMVPAASEADYSPLTDFIESKEPGAKDLRSGEPHTNTSATVMHPVNGGGHLLSAVSVSFRYVAGYTGQGEAATVSVALVDALNGTLVARLWTSPPLGNYSWDKFTGYSPPLKANLTGLAVAWPRSLAIAFHFRNNDRNVHLHLPSIVINAYWSGQMQKEPFHPSDLSQGFMSANLSMRAALATERIFGLGQGNWTAEGGCPSGVQRVVPLLRNGQRVNLQQRKFHVSIPFVYSTAGYAFLFNMPGYGSVEVGELRVGGMEWKAEATALGLDFWVSARPAEQRRRPEEGDQEGQRTKRSGDVTAGGAVAPSAAPALAAEPLYKQYADATGHAPSLRSSAKLFWQSRNRYKSSSIAMGIADQYARLELPVGVLVIDYKNMVKDGDFAPNPACFPSVANLSSHVSKTLKGATTVFSFWPEVLKGAEAEAALDAAGCLINGDLGGLAIDSTPAACRKLIWTKFLEPHYFSQGVDAYWLDETDGEGTGIGDGDHGYDTSYGPARAYSNLWVNHWLQIFTDPVAAAGVWAGGARHGVVLWSSDIWSSFEQLASMVPQGVHSSLSGIPWWTTDVGGYGCGKSPPNDSPYMRELIVRWYEFGLFCPVFRTHGCRAGPSEPDVSPCFPTQGVGSCGYNEVWSYGEATQKLLSALVKARATRKMQSYISELEHNVSARGVPTMRPLWWEFADSAVLDVNDQYMLGSRLLVAPVTLQSATSRTIVFPAGSRWTSFWDVAKSFDGGQTVDVDAPLGQTPAFWRS
jgi:alpha-D-xyloside xylohydrolase